MKLPTPDLSNVSSRTVRMSAVGLSAAVMAVVWAIGDALTAAALPSVIVSSVTSLVMLVAQFSDVKARLGGAEVIEPGE